MSEKRLCRWKLISGTYDYPGGKVRAGEEFLAYAVPAAFRDIIELVEEGVEDQPKRGLKAPPSFRRLSRRPVPEESKPVKKVYSFLVQSRGVGWYDVINLEDGKPVNQHALRKAVAEQLAKELNDDQSR